jgi:hypothetical protein
MFFAILLILSLMVLVGCAIYMAAKNNNTRKNQPVGTPIEPSQLAKPPKAFGIAFLVALFSFVGLLCTDTKPVAPTSQTKGTVQASEQAVPVFTGSCTATFDFPIVVGDNYYVNVTNFKTKDKSCFEALRLQALSKAYLDRPFTLHYLDNLPKFNPPASGLYGSDAIRKKVIAQAIFLPNSEPNIIFDPFGFGKYED